MLALPTLALWVLVGLAAVWDAVQRRIPNRLILVGLLLGAAFMTQSDGLIGLGRSVLGMAVALLVLLLPFALRKMGGGDVKIVMVCGAFLGWAGVLHVILIGTVFHGLLALGILVGHKVLVVPPRWFPSADHLPHAIGFAAAAVVTTLQVVKLF